MVGEDHLEFLHAVWTRRPLFTYVFLTLNILVFLLMALAGGSTNEPTLMAFGVKSNAEIARGEWWRFITPIFIHIGMLHLIFNSYALWIVGPQVEKLYGAARFVILYVLTGVAGVCGSYFYHPQSISAGASGAIFGLFGVLLVFGVRYRKSIPPFFKRAVGTGVLPVIVLNLIIGFTIPAIDNSAHIGGLELIAIIVVSFYSVAKHYDGPQPSVRNLGRGLTQILSTGSATEQFIDAINKAQQTFESSADDLESRRTEHLQSLKADTAKSIDQLRKIPSLTSKADQLAGALLRVLQDQYELLQEVERAGTVTFAHSRRLRENVRSYEKIMSEFSQWVETEGRRYGIQMEKGR